MEAEFEVDQDVPDDLRFGVFREPGRKFQALLRFSNGKDRKNPDGKPDSRGLAIKLRGVEGRKALELADLVDPRDADSQDFLFLNQPALPFRHVKDFRKHFDRRKKYDPYPFLMKIASFVGFGLRRARIAGQIEASIEDPMAIRYWSTVPYRLGNQAAMKYHVEPRDQNPAGRTDGDNFLFDAAAERVGRGEVLLDFFIQLYEDEQRTPIEDASRAWNSDLKKAATIRVRRHSSEDLDRLRGECETMSFQPWHCLEEHQPLGSINRARCQIYIESSRRRGAGSSLSSGSAAGAH